MYLSIIMITKNAAGVVGDALESVVGLWNELLVADGGSTDETVDIVRKYGGKVFGSKETNLGKKKQWLLDKIGSQWVLVLDSDERVSPRLYKEIRDIVRSTSIDIVGYQIPYQNYVFGTPVYWGGEKYAKVRLFRKAFGRITPDKVHEGVDIQGKVGKTKGVIHHHSYRNPWQLLVKFTRYANTVAQIKRKQGEKVTLRKLLVYGPRMFWTRYVQDRGYRDGWRGLVLAGTFGYMEGLTYWLLLFIAGRS